MTMKEFDRIPVSKVKRATRFLATGASIGTNYLKHYGRKLVDPQLSKDSLHEDNAHDIYESLSELKGSALKVAQMLSMDRSLLPAAYQRKFAMAQYSAPPLSYPLVQKTFQKSFGKNPDQLFDTFDRKARHAASIGQVHQAELNDNKLAVKIQYPGVAESVRSDLAMVKPIALSMFKLNPAEYDEFIVEVESRLIEETDYTLELRRSIDLSERCRQLNNLVFPKYYPEVSSARILTMDWIDGQPLGAALKSEMSQDLRNSLGQALWDFYHFQIHQLREVHADPHPGNFIVTPNYRLGVIDFGCVKVVPDAFYHSYFQLLDRTLLDDQSRIEEVFNQLKFVHPDDSPSEKKFFTELFTTLVDLLGRPFHTGTFDFGESKYFDALYSFGEELTGMKELRQSKKARGVRDALYINRTYFGLYSLLHELKAVIRTAP